MTWGFLLFALFQQVSSLQAKWNGNVSLSNLDYYSYRRSTLAQMTIGQYKSLFLQSLNASEEHYDGIFGSAYAGGTNNEYPTHQLGYFPIASGWPALSALNGDFSCASGYVAASYITLEEVRNGRVIQTISLNRLPWRMSNETIVKDELTWALLIGGKWLESFGAMSDDTEIISGQEIETTPAPTPSNTTEIHGMGKNQNSNNSTSSNTTTTTQSPTVVTDTADAGDLSIALLIVGSNITGKFPSGLTMTPRSMKVLVDISNFPYLDQQSSIRLTMQVVTATNVGKTVTYETQSERRMYAGTGSSSMYMDQDLYAMCDGTRQLITVEKKQLDDGDSSWGMVNYQLSGLKTNGIVSTSQAMTFTFPPGVRHISFDSIFGTGHGPEFDANASSSGGATHKEEDLLFHAPPTVDSLIPGVVVGSAIGALLLITVVLLWLRQGGYLSYFYNDYSDMNKSMENEPSDIRENEHYPTPQLLTPTKEEADALVNRETSNQQYQAL